MTGVDILRSQGACDGAIDWAEKHGGTLEDLWWSCTRPDWLWWWIRYSGAPLPDRRLIALCLADCAELMLPFVRGEHAQLVTEATIGIVRACVHGEATIDQVREVRAVFYSGYGNATYFAYCAADAAIYSDGTVLATGSAASHTVHLKRRFLCDIIREWIPMPVLS